MIELDDILECIESYEAVKIRLVTLERAIAEQFKLVGTEEQIHSLVLELDRSGVLDDGDIGSEWRFTYETLIIWEEMNDEEN